MKWTKLSLYIAHSTKLEMKPLNMKTIWHKGRKLSCNDGCVYKKWRNQYEAKFSPFSWWRVVQFHFVLFHNASFETNTKSKSRTTMTLRSVLTQDGYMGAVWWALTCILARSLWLSGVNTTTASHNGTPWLQKAMSIPFSGLSFRDRCPWSFRSGLLGWSFSWTYWWCWVWQISTWYSLFGTWAWEKQYRQCYPWCAYSTNAYSTDWVGYCSFIFAHIQES